MAGTGVGRVEESSLGIRGQDWSAPFHNAVNVDAFETMMIASVILNDGIDDNGVVVQVRRRSDCVVNPDAQSCASEETNLGMASCCIETRFNHDRKWLPGKRRSTVFCDWRIGVPSAGEDPAVGEAQYFQAVKICDDRVADHPITVVGA